MTISITIFIGYTQANDSLHRDSLWNILRGFQVPAKLIRLMKLCYTNSRGMVKVGGQLTDVFQVEMGLKQGCPLSCMLFNCTLEWVMRNTPQENDIMNMTSVPKCIRTAYADNSDVIGEYAHITNFERNGVRIGLSINELKTKAMKTSR